MLSNCSDGLKIDDERKADQARFIKIMLGIW